MGTEDDLSALSSLLKDCQDQVQGAVAVAESSTNSDERALVAFVSSADSTALPDCIAHANTADSNLRDYSTPSLASDRLLNVTLDELASTEAKAAFSAFAADAREGGREVWTVSMYRDGAGTVPERELADLCKPEGHLACAQ